MPRHDIVPIKRCVGGRPMPESSPELAYTPAHVLRDMIAAKRLSPVELMQFTLDRIERLNESLGAFRDRDGRPRHARGPYRRGGGDAGPRSWVPCTACRCRSRTWRPWQEVRFSQGSLVDDATASTNALCTDRVRAGGGIIVGKTNNPEHGHNGTTEEPGVRAAARNPWDPARTPGGSARRRGGGGGRGRHRHRPGLGRRRLDPHPRLAVGHLRHQGYPGPRPAQAC